MPAPAPKLIGSYTRPRVRVGDHVRCLYRETDCVVTSRTKARIPWPWVRPCGWQGGCGLWINDTLARAIRTESALAIRYWFGVSAPTVCKWRKAFGVSGHVATAGSKAACLRARRKALAKRKKRWTQEERMAASESARRRNQVQWLGRRWTPETGGWTAAEIELLGTDRDEVIARKLGRSKAAVAVKRIQLKIPVFQDRRRLSNRQ